METVRPPDLHWDEMIARHNQSIRNTVATLEKISPWLGEDWTFGNIAIVCGLDYASYRAPHIDWRLAAPSLSAWHQKKTESQVWHDTNAYDEAV
jgi:hypothetical protein